MGAAGDQGAAVAGSPHRLLFTPKRSIDLWKSYGPTTGAAAHLTTWLRILYSRKGFASFDLLLLCYHFPLGKSGRGPVPLLGRFLRRSGMD